VGQQRDRVETNTQIFVNLLLLIAGKNKTYEKV